MNKRPGIWIALVVIMGAGCGPPADEVINCRDLAPPEEAMYSALAEIVTAAGGKGCAGCHNTQAPLAGHNFEGPAVAYDSLSMKIDIIYNQVASGEMPEEGIRWEDDDLRLLRSWYCYGGAYE